MANKSSGAEHVISLPKGGGAIKGIGETFQPNLFSGTGNHTIPIAISKSRNDFGPALSLQYSSGNGNGFFGMGWQLSVPRIIRKTEHGLPKYDDRDVFVISGAEDLVPYLAVSVDPGSDVTNWIREAPIARPFHSVYRYRTRTEGTFARIERWVHNTTNDVHWRSITKDNITSIYGGTIESRIVDPKNQERVYEWLLTETFDAVGNRILYEYAKDDPLLYDRENLNLSLNEIFEQNRNPAQSYIRRICYGPLNSPVDASSADHITYADGSTVGCLRNGRRYAFEVLFDYGNLPLDRLSLHTSSVGEQELFGLDTPLREDRFSTFRSGFEIRTLRRCHRVLMLHHFAELGAPTVVKSTDFDYRVDSDTQLSFLVTATITSYQKDASGNYKQATLPPLGFKYSEFRPLEQHYQSIMAQGSEMPPLALNNSNIALVDLFGDGLADVVHSGSSGFRYWKNLGNGVLERPRPLPQIPENISLSQNGVGFGDMGGDGQTDLLVHSGPRPGYFETTPEGTWQKFKPYEVFPSFNLADPNLRLVDLTGNGLPDALITQGENFLWCENLGENGFGSPQFIPRQHDQVRFPDVYLDDSAGRIRLADMTGDGMSDIVMIHNGRIDYWPNVGYGRFGLRITMENSPQLDIDFNPKRLFLADINGTGCADLVYVDSDRVHFWFNLSGNGWSARQTIPGTPVVTDVDSIQFTDIFGTGTTALLWSFDYVGQAAGNYKALDFCGGKKPYVLVEIDNNMGAATRVSYAPSTRYYLDDQANGTPWITQLPFPVQVVDRVEVIDQISKTKFVTTYKYHHGYFDGAEREFRGFGRVDQFDSELFEDFSHSGLNDSNLAFTNGSADLHVPPIETRSWFHTGVYFNEDSATLTSSPFDFSELIDKYRCEYYQGDSKALPLDYHVVEQGEIPREAYRALRGALLRTEVYARDGSASEIHPYQVTEARHRVVQVQPKSMNYNGVYLSYQLESLTYHYERSPTDPRVSHSLTLEVDEFFNPLQMLAIGYGRRLPDLSLPTELDQGKQTKTLITYTKNTVTNSIDNSIIDPDNYRTPLPSEIITYELTGFVPASGLGRFTVEEWQRDNFALINDAVEIGYGDTVNASIMQKRLIAHSCTRYRKNDLTDLLPIGVIESLGLRGESYELAFTPELLTKVYGQRVTDSMLAVDGGYSRNQGANWWVCSGRVFYSDNTIDTPAEELSFAQRHYFSPQRFCDPFNNTTIVIYDQYDLLLKQTIDPLNNVVIADQDYRLLQPFRMTDPNGNRAEVAFDIRGLVVGTAVMGKIGESKGDILLGFEPNLTPEQINEFQADPLGNAANLLGRASTRIIYDFDSYRRVKQPAFAATLERITHVNDPLPIDGREIRLGFSYTDGFGREIVTKLQAESGPVRDGGPTIHPRWVGSGWTVFNNKNKPVKQYEPYFDETHEFRYSKIDGVGSTLFYDPLSRVVATLHPNHTWQKVIFDSWREESWDVNDTILIADPKTDATVGKYFRRLTDSEYFPTWHAQRANGVLGLQELDAATKSAVHAATPSIAYADSLGRSFLTVAHNRFEREAATIEENYASRVELDIQGNQTAIVDAKSRVVMRYHYDMLGQRIHQSSMEAGQRWILNDVLEEPIYAWDSKNQRLRTSYDELRRPTDSFLQEGFGNELLVTRKIYGEGSLEPEVNNLRGKSVWLYDQAGKLTTDLYDFKGNLLSTSRQFARDYKNTLDWSVDLELDPEIFSGQVTYDALNRPISATAPDGSTFHPTFNYFDSLEKLDLNLRGGTTATTFVSNISYNAKGQRLYIDYGNNVRTTYEYDSLTFQVRNIRSTRGMTDSPLQNLSYYYDPIGNVTKIQDDAQQTIYFNNQVVTPNNEYTYDAIYRLISSMGREHIGQSLPQSRWKDDFRIRLPHPGDGQAMRQYVEKYEYDPLGNFEKMIHQAINGNWTRSYEYKESSLIEASEFSNRLSKTRVGGVGNSIVEPYAYDAHGNMSSMPHLAFMKWDFEDQLKVTGRQIVSSGSAEKTYYVYDAEGQRVRKVTERQNGTRKNERNYLTGYEVYREYGANGNDVVLQRQSLHVMDDKQRIALLEFRTDIPTGEQVFRFQLGNHLGSAMLELDLAAQIVSYEEYSPYGLTSYQAGRNMLEVSQKRYRYAGKERDEETDFSYYGFRYYIVSLGRWLNTDPAFLKDGLNLYQYTRSNPVTLVDLVGTDSNTTLLDEMKSVIEERHENDFARIDALDNKRDKQIVTSFVVIGERAFSGCDTKVSRIELFDIGVEMVGKLYGLEKEFQDAAKRGAADRKRRDDRQLQKWSDGSESNRVERAAAMERAFIQRMLRTLGNIEGGLGGTIGFAIGGDTGSDVGAMVDTVAVAAHGVRGARGSYSPKVVNPTPAPRPELRFLAGPGDPTDAKFGTFLIRIDGSRVTYDSPAPLGAGANRDHMQVIRKLMERRLGDFKAGNWWTGTHGDKNGRFGDRDQLDDRILKRERGFGRFYGWRVHDVSKAPKKAVMAGKLEGPNVYSWCYSSATLCNGK